MLTKEMARQAHAYRVQELGNFIDRMAANESPPKPVNETLSSREHSKSLVQSSNLDIVSSGKTTDDPVDPNAAPWNDSKKLEGRQVVPVPHTQSSAGSGLPVSGGEGSRLFKMGNERSKVTIQKSKANVQEYTHRATTNSLYIGSDPGALNPKHCECQTQETRRNSYLIDHINQKVK